MAWIAADARVLLVDNNPDILVLWRMVLTVHGGFDDITEATDGEEALRLLAKTPPDVVVTGHWMRGVSGLAVIAAARLVCPHAVIIMSSSDPSVGPLALQRGASSFMNKFSSVTEDLADDVHGFLRSSREVGGALRLAVN